MVYGLAARCAMHSLVRVCHLVGRFLLFALSSGWRCLGIALHWCRGCSLLFSFSFPVWCVVEEFCLDIMLPTLPSPDTSAHLLHHFTTHVGPWGLGTSLGCREGFPSTCLVAASFPILPYCLETLTYNILMRYTFRDLHVGMVITRAGYLKCVNSIKISQKVFIFIWLFSFVVIFNYLNLYWITHHLL